MTRWTAIGNDPPPKRIDWETVITALEIIWMAVVIAGILFIAIYGWRWIG